MEEMLSPAFSGYNYISLRLSTNSKPTKALRKNLLILYFITLYLRFQTISHRLRTQNHVLYAQILLSKWKVQASWWTNYP